MTRLEYTSYQSLTPAHCAACDRKARWFSVCDRCDLHLCVTCAADAPAHPCDWHLWLEGRRIHAA